MTIKKITLAALTLSCGLIASTKNLREKIQLQNELIQKTKALIDHTTLMIALHNELNLCNAVHEDPFLECDLLQKKYTQYETTKKQLRDEYNIIEDKLGLKKN